MDLKPMAIRKSGDLGEQRTYLTEYGIMDGELEEISDTQRYKTLGNAVTTSIITAIGEALLEHIEVTR